ncbi:MAG: hypothetical protein F6K17_19305, partial [Okeania sp. SIO3C4]|nr:hypothetical protein [Okeania sp. SIO3C4]
MMDSTGFSGSDFDIRNYLDILGKRTKEGKYICPNCGGHNLSINKENGKYTCYDCEDRPAVFKAIKEKAGEWKDFSESWKKPLRPESTKNFLYLNREGDPLVKVERIDLGDGKKKFPQWRWDASQKRYVRRLTGISREDIPIYRYKEVRKAISEDKKIFVAEGESCVDALWQLGIPATTNIGGAGKWQKSDSVDLEGAKIVICPDRDIKGIKHTDKIAEDFPEAEWLYAYPHSVLWDRLSKEHGADVADWIVEDSLTAEDLLAAIEQQKRQIEVYSNRSSKKLENKSDGADDSSPKVDFKPRHIRWDKSCDSWRIGPGGLWATIKFLREELKL